MRELKFRAWDTVNQCMDYPNMIYMSPVYKRVTCYCQDVYFDTTEIMQYTGTKDKDNEEIYEGDILDITYGKWYEERKGLRRIGVVKYCDKTASFVVKINNSKVEVHLYDSRKKDIKKLGNIYEHPHLFESQPCATST